MWLPDVAVFKILINLGVIALGVWALQREIGDSLEEERGLILLLIVVGTIILIAGVAFHWLRGVPNVREHILLVEIRILDIPIMIGYTMIAIGLLGIVKKYLQRNPDDA